MNNLALNNQEDKENQNRIDHINNILGLEVESIYNDIIHFIQDNKSKSTQTNYLRYYKNMFMYILKKDINTLTWDDLKLITRKKVEYYRDHLVRKYKKTTVNQVIFSCKALWDKFIQYDEYENFIRSNPFDLVKLKEKKNTYDSLTDKEIEQLFDYCLELKYKPLTQKLYFEFLYIVTCRKSIAQTLTWNDINKNIDVNTGNSVWIIKFQDKGKEIVKAISDEFYNKLKEIYSEKDYRNKIFNIDNKTIDNTLSSFCEKFNISRNIVQHSIKSSGLDLIQNVFNDINVTALAAQHSNINTTYKHYMNKNQQFTKHPSYIMGKKYDINMLKGLGEDILIKLIEKCGKETILKMCLELEEITK